MIRVKNALAENVWQTVCWFDVFGQAASAEEIHRFLFWQKASLAAVEQELKKDPHLGHSLGFYFLKGRDASVLARCSRQFQAKKLWRRVAKHLFLLRATPFVRFAAVGNTLAMGWPEKNSDIDLLIVAAKNRLFTTRFFLTFLTQIFGMRRHGRKVTGRFCLSFFLAEDSLNLEKLAIGAQDPYLAFWAATLIPLRGEGAEFFAANVWIKKYFPNLKLSTTARKFRRKTWSERILGGHFGDLIEKLLRDWQLRRARRKRKNLSKNAVVIADTVLKFHETDQRERFLREWRELIKAGSKKKR